MGPPELAWTGFQNSWHHEGDVLGGKDPLTLVASFFLTFLVIGLVTSLGIAGFILLNVSKTIQSLFLWGVVTAGYFLIIIITICCVGIVVVSFYGALFEGEWGFGILGLFFCYPAYKLCPATWYALGHLPDVVRWVYQTVGKT